MIFLGKRALWTIWIILLLIFLFLTGYVMENVSQAIAKNALNPECAIPIDLHMIGISHEEAVKAFDCMGSEAMAIYENAESKENIIYPIFNALFFSFTIFSLASYCLKNIKAILFLTFFVFFSATLDILENFYVLKLINQYPALQEDTITWVSALNKVKWISIFTNIVVLLFLVLIALIKLASNKRALTARI